MLAGILAALTAVLTGSLISAIEPSGFR